MAARLDISSASYEATVFGFAGVCAVHEAALHGRNRTGMIEVDLRVSSCFPSPLIPTCAYAALAAHTVKGCALTASLFQDAYCFVAKF